MCLGHTGELPLTDNFSMSLGQRLRAARRQRGWSLGDIESRTDGEFKASVVGAYERGERAISVQRFVRLAEVYGVGPGELLPEPPDTEDLVIDIHALESGVGDDLVERYLSAIRMLRKEPSTSEVRRSDQAIIGHLLRSAGSPVAAD